MVHAKPPCRVTEFGADDVGLSQSSVSTMAPIRVTRALPVEVQRMTKRNPCFFFFAVRSLLLLGRLKTSQADG